MESLCIERGIGRSILILTESQSTPLLKILTKKEILAPHRSFTRNNLPIVNENEYPQTKLSFCYQKRNLLELISHQKLPEVNKKLITEAQAVIILNARLEDVKIVQDLTQQNNIPLVICGKDGDKILLKTASGKINYQSLNSGVLSEDGSSVHVGAVICSGQLSTVTTDTAHNLDSGDTVTLVDEEYTVANILADNVFSIQTSDNIPQGTEVMLIKKLSWPTEHQTIDLTGLEMLSLDDCENMEICGWIAQHLVNILLTPGLTPVRKERQIRSSAKEIEEAIEICVCGETSSYLAATLKEILPENCQIYFFSENDKKTKIDIEKYSCFICIGASFNYRQMIGGRCLDMRKPLIILSQAGLTGCLESYIPDKTISYTCLSDPAEKDYPHCVLKSFPHTSHQAFIWAVNKLSSYQQKWKARNEFIKEHKGNLSELGHHLASGKIIDGAKETQFFNLNFGVSPTWYDCVRVARIKLEKYFVHKALHLTAVFPADTVLNSGALFWSWPKLIPSPVTWDWQTGQHSTIVLHLATMFAKILGVVDKEPIDIAAINVPKYLPKDKSIVTDESVTKEESEITGNLDLSGLCDYVSKATVSEAVTTTGDYSELCRSLGNLRCQMYGIPRPTKQQAHSLITGSPCCNPAVGLQLASLTNQVLAEIVSGGNGWSAWISNTGDLNLADNLAPKYTQITDSLRTSIWDTWQITQPQVPNEPMTLQSLLDHIHDLYKVHVTSVFHKSKIIYMPMFPYNKKEKLLKPISKLVNKGVDQEFVYLTLLAANPVAGGEDIELPKTKFMF